MPTATVAVPGLLDRFTDGETALTVEAATLGGAIDRLLDRHPALEPHLFTDRGALRPHVRLFVDDEPVPMATAADRAAAADRPIEPGARIVFLQAVSGGSAAIAL